MEEREKSLSAEKHCPLSNENEINDHHHQPLSPPNPTTKANSDIENDDPLPESSQPAFHTGTYIIQVPKDQIYRVPPPENALILAQRNQNQNYKQKRSSCCFSSCNSCILSLFRGKKSG